MLNAQRPKLYCIGLYDQGMVGVNGVLERYMTMAFRSPDIMSVLFKIIFFHSKPKFMIWELKRIVSMRQFF